ARVAFFYLLTGAHAVQIVMGVLVLIWIIARQTRWTAMGQYIAVDLSTLYFAAMTVLWTFLFCFLVFALSLDNRGDARSGSGKDPSHFEFGNFEEAAQHVGIELCATACVQATNGFFVFETFAVAAIRDHRIEGIDDRDDT